MDSGMVATGPVSFRRAKFTRIYSFIVDEPAGHHRFPNRENKRDPSHHDLQTQYSAFFLSHVLSWQ